MVNDESIAQRGLASLVWAGLVIFSALTVWLAVSSIFFPYQLDYGEGIMLELTRLLAQGKPIYKNLFDFPFVASNYPPVVFLLAAPFWNLFPSSYMPGRILNFAALLVSASLVYMFVRSETRERRIALLSALFFMSSTFIYHWSPLFRVDLIGLGFALGGIWAIHLFETSMRGAVTRRPIALLVCAGGLFLLCLYSKQSLLAGPVAGIGAVILRQRRVGSWFAIVFALAGGAIFLGISWLTQGEFWTGLIVANASEWRLDTFLQIFVLWVETHLILIILALTAFLGKIRRGRIGVLELYFVTALASVGLSGRVGAWENYYFEATAIICVFAGICIADWKETKLRTLRENRLILPIILITQLFLYVPEHDPRIAIKLMQETATSNSLLAPILSGTLGTIISEDMGALVTANKQVAYYTFIYSSLARAGKWDQHWELSNLEARSIPIVVLDATTRQDVDHYRRLTHDFLSALDANYRLAETAGAYQVYRPDQISHISQFEFEDKLALIGWSRTPETIDAKTRGLTVTLLWHAHKNLAVRYKAFVHLEDTQGRVVAQSDKEPRDGAFPTTRWIQGDKVREVYMLEISDALPRGNYFLRVGWYDALTGDRLSIGDSDYANLEEIVLP
jgi:hypothetical protein